MEKKDFIKKVLDLIDKEQDKVFAEWDKALTPNAHDHDACRECHGRYLGLKKATDIITTLLSEEN